MESVIINGKMVMDRRKVLTVDEGEILAASGAVEKDLKARLDVSKMIVSRNLVKWTVLWGLCAVLHVVGIVPAGVGSVLTLPLASCLITAAYAHAVAHALPVEHGEVR